MEGVGDQRKGVSVEADWGEVLVTVLEGVSGSANVPAISARKKQREMAMMSISLRALVRGAMIMLGLPSKRYGQGAGVEG